MRRKKVLSHLDRRLLYPLRARTVAARPVSGGLFHQPSHQCRRNLSPHVSETYYCSETTSSEESVKVAVYENSIFKCGEPHKKKESYIDEEILFNFEQPNYWNENGRFAKILQERFEQGFNSKPRRACSGLSVFNWIQATPKHIIFPAPCITFSINPP